MAIIKTGAAEPPEVLTPNNDNPGGYYDVELGEDTSNLIRQFKQGWRTTEFWLTVATGAFVVFGPEIGVNLSTEQIVAIVGVVAPYIGARGWLKTNRVKALSE